MSKKTPALPRSRAKKTKGADSQSQKEQVRSIADAPPVLVIPGSRKKRFVLCVGSQRVAFDFATQISELPPPRIIELPGPIEKEQRGPVSIDSFRPRTSREVPLGRKRQGS
jgi:hypothetical protein